MQLGAVFPQLETSPDPAFIREFATAAESMDFTHLLAFEHVLSAQRPGEPLATSNGNSAVNPFHEVMVLFGYLAAITTRIGLVTGVLVLPQRQTALVAKQATEIALLSGDRLRLGVGVGWNAREYEGLGVDFTTRGRRQEEQIELLRKFWTDPLVTFEGRFHRANGVGIAPRSERPVPIWLGGTSDAARDRAARVGDGFIFNSDPDPQNTVEIGLAMRRQVESEGRDPASFGLEARLEYSEGKDAYRRGLDVYAQAGFDYVTINTMGAGLAWPGGHLEALEDIAASTDPAFRTAPAS